MTSIRLALLALAGALALGACAKQVPVAAPVPAPAHKTLDIYHLCDDARFESMCTPASTERGMQVDTNLESARLRTTFPA